MQEVVRYINRDDDVPTLTSSTVLVFCFPAQLTVLPLILLSQGIDVMLTRPYVGETALFWNGIVKLQLDYIHPKAVQPPGMQREVSFFFS